MNYTEKNKKIAVNTIMLYIRMVLVMLVSLYTSRVVLNALGVNDYGIYSAVGGFVATFGVISNSLSAAISRFITYELGTGNVDRLSKIFSTALMMQMLIAGLLIIVSVTLGSWFLNTKMTIPPNRMNAANWVFYLSVITFSINLLSVPYNACIVAHERMKAFAYIGVYEAFGRLAIAFAVRSASDKLIFYAVLMCFLAVTVRVLYGWYCRRNFQECRFRFSYDRNLVKEIFGFAGWNFIGTSAGVLKEQGVNVLLNVFCGPAVNAARGLAYQVKAAVTQFSQNFITAINPQITKSFATDDRKYSFDLATKGARFSFLLMLCVCLPIFAEAPVVLSIWLGIVPEYLVVFLRITLIDILVDSLSYTLITLMLATGKIRNYQIVVGGLLLLNFPLAYLVLKMGFPPQYVFVVSVCIAAGCLILRLCMLNKMIDFPVRLYLHDTLFRVIAVTVLASIVPVLITSLMPQSVIRMVIDCGLTLLTSCVVIYLVGIKTSERTFVNDRLKSLLRFRV